MKNTKKLIVAATVVCTALLGFGAAAYAANEADETFISPMEAKVTEAIAMYDDALQRMGINIDLGDFGDIGVTAIGFSDEVEYISSPSIDAYSPYEPVVIESKEDVKILVDIMLIFSEKGTGVSIEGAVVNAIHEAGLYEFFCDRWTYVSREIRRNGLLELIATYTYEEIKAMGMFEIYGLRDSFIYLGLTPTLHKIPEYETDPCESYEYQAFPEILPKALEESIIPLMEAPRPINASFSVQGRWDSRTSLPPGSRISYAIRIGDSDVRSGTAQTSGGTVSHSTTYSQTNNFMLTRI
jgi:hypothetical protein